MKALIKLKLILTILIFCAFTQLSETKIPWKELKVLRKEIKSNFKVGSDYSSGQEITWFSSKKKKVGSTEYFKFYFGFSDDKQIKPMRFKYYYSSTGWLFIDKIKIIIGSRKKDNMRVYEFDIDRDDVDRKTLGGASISETIDMSVPKELEDFLKDVMEQEKNIPVIVELHGDKYKRSGTWTNQWKNSYGQIIKAKEFIQKKYK